MNRSSRTVITLRTEGQSVMIDVSGRIEQSLHAMQAHDGMCVLFCPHTTSGLTINEGADPNVARDIEAALTRMVPAHPGFLHAEGNSDAHVKSTLTGVSLCVGVEAGHLALGRWQGVFFCEFDGPRQRELWLWFIGA